MTDPTRRDFLQAVPAAAAVPFLGGNLFGSSALTTLATTSPDELKMFDDGIPSWVVKHDADSADSVRTWVDDNEDRRILSEHSQLDMMTVVAPRPHVTGGRFGSGLAHKSYVSMVDLNIVASLPDPLGALDDSSAWDFGLSRTQRTVTKASGQLDAGVPSSSGVAFNEDATVSPMQQVREASYATGHGVDTSTLTIGVIDSGLNAGAVFEDGSGNTRILDQSKDHISNTTVAEGGLSVLSDGAGHGTFVTSQMAANASDSTYDGFLPAADILALRALDDDGSGSTDDIVGALEYLLTLNVTPDAVCMSLGSPLFSQAIADAVAAVVEAGIPVFVAVGNDRFGTIWTASPSDADDALGVTATTATVDETKRKVAYFANTGPDPGTLDDSGGNTSGTRPDIGAPGMEVEAMTPDGKKVKSGTSMAAPDVAAAAALLQGATGGLAPADIYDRLRTYARPAPKIAEAEMKHGLLDVDAAINETEPDQTQAEAMNADAQARDAEFRALSNAQGGLATRYLF
ncbi:S8/S53 family peptidase [Halostella sp. JP-L12]|uniref:S8/S53 family peptidase n=1 Tax=Halostella TaxID=1843185 RepID=UPI000EF848B1|nr:MULTISPECIES: S8/S53 family peptidase [Halostella]NHN49976.1 S8/S53 family peptidase [Halostella sp. JP-L12]